MPFFVIAWICNAISFCILITAGLSVQGWIMFAAGQIIFAMGVAAQQIVDAIKNKNKET